MSNEKFFRLSEWHVDQSTGLSHVARSLFFCICGKSGSTASGHRPFSATMTTLAGMAGTSPRGAAACIDALIERGLIRVDAAGVVPKITVVDEGDIDSAAAAQEASSEPLGAAQEASSEPLTATPEPVTKALDGSCDLKADAIVEEKRPKRRGEERRGEDTIYSTSQPKAGRKKRRASKPALAVTPEVRRIYDEWNLAATRSAAHRPPGMVRHVLLSDDLAMDIQRQLDQGVSLSNFLLVISECERDDWFCQRITSPGYAGPKHGKGLRWLLERGNGAKFQALLDKAVQNREPLIDWRQVFSFAGPIYDVPPSDDLAKVLNTNAETLAELTEYQAEIVKRAKARGIKNVHVTAGVGREIYDEILKERTAKAANDPKADKVFLSLLSAELNGSDKPVDVVAATAKIRERENRIGEILALNAAVRSVVPDPEVTALPEINADAEPEIGAASDGGNHVEF